jgi:excisionase family DNA binding protein
VSLECAWCGQQKDWLSTAEAAAFLGIPARTLRRACREGRLPGAKMDHIAPGGKDGKGAYRIPASVVSMLAGTASAADS